VIDIELHAVAREGLGVDAGAADLAEGTIQEAAR